MECVLLSLRVIDQCRDTREKDMPELIDFAFTNEFTGISIHAGGIKTFSTCVST